MVTKYNLSHLSVPVVNRLLRKKTEVHPKFFYVVKNFLKNVTLQILNFIPVS